MVLPKLLNKFVDQVPVLLFLSAPMHPTTTRVVRTFLKVVEIGPVLKVCGVQGEEEGREHGSLWCSVGTQTGGFSAAQPGVCSTGSQRPRRSWTCPPVFFSSSLSAGVWMVLNALKKWKKAWRCCRSDGSGLFAVDTWLHCPQLPVAGFCFSFIPLDLWCFLNKVSWIYFSKY